MNTSNKWSTRTKATRREGNDMDEGKAGHYQLVQMTDIKRFGGRKLQRLGSKLKLFRSWSWSMSTELLIHQDTKNHMNSHCK